MAVREHKRDDQTSPPPRLSLASTDARVAETFLFDAEERRRRRAKKNATGKSEQGSYTEDISCAVFAVDASGSASSTPAADVAAALEAAQLARAAFASFPERSDSASFPFPDLVCVAPFHRGGRDFYFATCAVDFAAFALVVLFYQLTVHADAAGEALVETYHQGLFPIDYVLATTSCLALVVLDRILYLHKAHVLKTAYHFLSFAFFSAFTFKLYHHHGALTLRATETGRDGLLRVFFLLKSASFALNARQVRSGYKRHGHDGVYSSPASSASRVDALTYLGSALYFATPFLYELRVLLDYACVDSSLDLHDWLKLENIKRDLRRADFRNRNARAKHPFGSPQPRSKKVLAQGGGAFVLLLSVVLAPFFIFSTSNPQVGVNPVYKVSLNVSISSAVPNGVHHVHGSLSSNDGHLTTKKLAASYPLFLGGRRASLATPESWASLRTASRFAPPVKAKEQVQEVCLAPDSDTVWHLPPPALSDFNETGIAVGSRLTAEWTLTRALPADETVVVAASRGVVLDEKTVAAFRDALSFDGDRDGKTYERDETEKPDAGFPSVLVKNLYPRVWRLYGAGEPAANYTTTQGVDCVLSLRDDRRAGDKDSSFLARWWALRCFVDVGKDQSGSPEEEEEAFSPCASVGFGPEIVLVSAEVATGALASFSKLVGGVTGMYVAYVLAVGHFARGMTTNLVARIPFVELPSTHRLLKLCDYIYAMRAAREFVLEEKLFWLLVRIYRSNAVLFEFSRTPAGGATPERPPLFSQTPPPPSQNPGLTRRAGRTVQR